MSRIHHALMLSAIASIFVAAAPAAAKSGGAASGSHRDAAKSGKDAQASTDQKRYCTVFQITGSLIPQKVCKSRQEWAAEGVDVDAKQE